MGEKELIKDVPLEYEGDQVLLVPILNHIKYLGKPITQQSISYFSEEDEMDVYVGIEGVNIPGHKSIPLEELKAGSNYKLTLNIKVPKEQNCTNGQQKDVVMATNGKPEES
jgi:hypothetical protein